MVVDIRNFVANNFPDIEVGLGGCTADNNRFKSCGYDITVFDNTSKPVELIHHDSNFVVINHGSLEETVSSKLLQYGSLQVIQDPSWNLHMLLSKIHARRTRLFRDLALNSIIESMFCCQKAKYFLGNSAIFASCWQKCASFYLADAIVALNDKRPSPSHMLDILRDLPNTLTNQHVAVLFETIGIERATTVLLERIFKSTIGFIEMTNIYDTSLISSKFDFFISNTMFASCYFYLGYLNRNNLANIGTGTNPDLDHLLKTAFDIDADSNQTIKNLDVIHNSCVSLLEISDNLV